MMMPAAGGGRMPPAIKWLLIANVALYAFTILPLPAALLQGYGSLVPYKVYLGGQLWRLVSYMFLHGGVWHLAFNMLALWMFGVELEYRWGTRRFVTFYFLAGIGAGLLSFPLWYRDIIGASGAVLAILTAYAYYYPDRQILLFFIFPVPVRIAVVIIGAISLFLGLQSAGGVAHFTHLGGIVMALLYIKTYDPVMNWLSERRSLRQERSMRRRAEENAGKKRHFEEVIDPILKKISEQGMESLTGKEKAQLREASRKSPDQMRKTGIIPFEKKKKG
jgi:membrane associated rhomboid family serine protease